MITPSRARLPPPAIFTHDETLHAILLPPLAVFLGDLSTPEHLIKLHDILDRFRTPKSYHRIDVRLVESSELPPDTAAADEGHKAGDPRGGTDQAASVGGERVAGAVLDEAEYAGTKGQAPSRKRKRSFGDPVILPEGVGMEEYLLAQPRKPDAEEDEGRNVQTNAGDNKGANMVPTPANELLAAVADGFTPTVPTESPFPTYELPLAAPTRRVRELRLDLRTLDAAALFQLETWRREVLGLQRLDLEHPDSIWYKDPSPSTLPVEPTSAKRRPGRPAKRRSTTRDTEVGCESGPEDVQVQADGELVEALAQRGEDLDVTGQSVDALDPLPDATIVDALGGIGMELEQTLPAPSDPSSVEEGEPELDPLDLDSILSPSPDVILDDLFDRREDRDPDFVPPSPKSQRKRGKRTRGTPTPDIVADSSAFGNLEDVINLAAGLEAEVGAHRDEAMESIELVPGHLVPGPPPPPPPSARLVQRKVDRKYAFDGVVLPARRRRPLATHSSSSKAAGAKMIVLDLSSPEKNAAKIRVARKSVRFGPLQGMAREDAIVEDTGGSALEADASNDRGGTEGMEEGDHPLGPITPTSASGADEWDFLRDL